MTDGTKDLVKVAARQRRETEAELLGTRVLASKLDGDIADVERMLNLRGIAVPGGPGPNGSTRRAPPPPVRPWYEIVVEAEAASPGEASFSDLLSDMQIADCLRRHTGWSEEFRSIHRLRGRDYVIACVAGSLAGLIDVLLVGLPRRAATLGSPAIQGGWLSDAVKDGFAHLLSQERIHALEREFPVPFDFSTNNGIAEAVKGLGPRSHRLQSLGHDPLLAWVFGVRDILCGSFTAIGSDGRWTCQAIPGAVPGGGDDPLVMLVDALVRVGGHLLSDVGTMAGLPPPLFGLLQLIQSGDINGRTVSELSRAMYASGYDFRHSLAGGIGTALVEAVVRLLWAVGELADGKCLSEAVPVGPRPRLQASLLIGHSVAAAVNGAKVAILQNPMALNWVQWFAFLRYLLPQAHWLLVGKDGDRAKFVEGRIQADFHDLQATMAETWTSVFGQDAQAAI